MLCDKHALAMQLFLYIASVLALLQYTSQFEAGMKLYLILAHI